MLYLLALLAPPLACIGAGKFWHAVLNLLLCFTFIGIPVAMIHAWMVVKYSYQMVPGIMIVNNQNQAI